MNGRGTTHRVLKYRAILNDRKGKIKVSILATPVMLQLGQTQDYLPGQAGLGVRLSAPDSVFMK